MKIQHLNEYVIILNLWQIQPYQQEMAVLVSMHYSTQLLYPYYLLMVFQLKDHQQDQLAKHQHLLLFESMYKKKYKINK